MGIATIALLIAAAAILARSASSTAARMHAVYGGATAWWLFSMSMIASADGPEEIELWARLLHVSLGMLPGVVFHLNMVTAGLDQRFRRRIRARYGVSVAVTLFCLMWPDLFSSPHEYSWGPYPNYTIWGLVPLVPIIVTMLEIFVIYGKAVKSTIEGSAYRRKLSALYRGNILAAVAMLDFLPVFGIGVYPFGFATMTLMAGATVFACVRYRLIDITPEFAAEQILATLPDSVFVVDSQNIVRLANEASARTFSSRIDDLLERPLAEIAPELEHADACADFPGDREITLSVGRDMQRVMRVSCADLHDQAGHSVGHVWVLHDLTEQRLAEAEKDELEGWVRHSQKLETLGVMARGVAHDFNNLLTAILGSAELAQARLPGTSDIANEIRTITTAAERATDLTTQMLTFAGEGPTIAQPVDLNALCVEIEDLIHAAVSKKARLDLLLDDDMPQVVVDRGQMSQVILNLVANASDALEGAVGQITLRTSLLLAESSDDDAELTRFACLEVADTGVGMDRETKDRIFDPFFTTKFAGHGLGLATVMGIVEAHGGRIRIETEPGAGTSVTVALPAPIPEPPHEGSIRKTIGKRLSGTGLVLLADDEPDVRNVVGAMLRSAGYEVVESSDGCEAVEVFGDQRAEISCVLLDMAMPNMDGLEAMSEIRRVSPDMPVVLMSGYPEVGSSERSIGTLFLQKPFRSNTLLSRIEQALTTNRVGP